MQFFPAAYFTNMKDDTESGMKKKSKQELKSTNFNQMAITQQTGEVQWH